MNELIPSNPPPVLAALFLVLPFLSLYALWRMHRATGSSWLRWNQIPHLPFSIFEMIVILAVVALALQTGLLVFLPFASLAAAGWYSRKYGTSLQVQWGLESRLLPLSSRVALNGYIALLLPVAVASALSFYLCELFGQTDFIQPVVKDLLSADVSQIITLFLLATIFAPLWEEMVFRGTIYPWLKARMPQPAALLLSALVFAAIHHHLPSFLPLTVLGIALALAYEYTGSLLASILLHALFNFATCVNLLLMRPA